MTAFADSPAEKTGQTRVLLSEGIQVEWKGAPYFLAKVGPTVCELAWGRVRINVATVEVVAELLASAPTAIDQASMASGRIDRTGWLDAPLRRQCHALELSQRLNQVQTGYALGVPCTGADHEKWAPFWELRSFTKRSEAMAAEISNDTDSVASLGMDKISGRQIRRLAKRFAKENYDPSCLLDLRTTAYRDPACGLNDEQRSVVDAQLLEQRAGADVSQKALVSKCRIAFVQRHVTAPPAAKLRRYVKESLRRHELEHNAKYRRNTAARPQMSLEQVATTHAGEYVEIDEWCIDMAGSVNGVMLHDLRLLVALDVHTRAILAIDVTVGAATIETVLSFLFRTITPVSHRIGSYPVPCDVHLPVPDRLVADLAGMLDAKWHKLPAPPIDTIVTDQGSQFRSRHVEALLERLMISVLPMPPGRPTGKPHVEALFDRLKEFISPLPGFTGGSPDKRGDAKSVEAAQLAPHDIQDLFLRFAIGYNRAEHQGLPLTADGNRHMSPLEMLAQSNAQRGNIETLNAQSVPYWFLPMIEKKINTQKIRHDKHDFDTAVLDDLRGTKQWFHYSRLDPTRLWTFHPVKQRWIMLRGRATTKAIHRSQSRGEAAVTAALETTDYHTINDHKDIAAALASAYALTPELSDDVCRRRISDVWRRRHEKQLLDSAPPAETAGEQIAPGDDWIGFHDGSDDWDTE